MFGLAFLNSIQIQRQTLDYGLRSSRLRFRGTT